MNDTTDEHFEALVRYLRDTRGFDFTGYKRASLMRRVRHRMEQAGCVSFESYLDILQASSDEFAALFNTVLINVTAFFRDPGAWDFVASDVIPRLLADRVLTTRFEYGVRDARQDRMPTRWPCCWSRRWGPTPSGSA